MKKYFIGYFFFACATIGISQSNVGFEFGDLSGWAFSEGTNTNSTTMAGCCPLAATNNAAVVSAGFDPNVPAINQVAPGGGNYSLRLGKMNNHTAEVTRATYTFTVSSANSIFSCWYAFVTDAANEICDESPYFNISFRNMSGIPIPNLTSHILAPSSGCTAGDPSFIQSGTYQYKNWTFWSYDLTNYINTPVTVEFTVGESVNGAHGAYAYIDGSFDIPQFALDGTGIPPGQTNTYFCAGSTGTLCAPPNLSYNWSGPNVTGQTGRCVLMSTAGTYSVTLTQGSNVSNLYTTFVAINAPVMSVTTATDNSTCSGPCTGSVSVSTSVNCDWNFFGSGLTFSPVNTSTFSTSNLCGGNYTLQLQESGTPIACPASTIITLQGSSSGPPIVSPNNTTLTCANPTVTLDANPPFPNSVIEYMWTGAGITSASNTQTISANQAGTYTVIATNTLTGCSATATVAVFSNTVTPNLTINASAGGIIQCGQCITLSPALTGTNAGVSYMWTSSTGFVFTSLTIAACNAGTYSLVVTSNNGCVSSAVIQVNAGMPALNITDSPIIHASCPYLSNGSIQPSISPAGTYTYTWSDDQHNILSGNPGLYNLSGGYYYLNITDGNACAVYSYFVPTYNPGCSSISGNIFNDINHDCINNTGDFNLSNVKVMATPGNYLGISDVNGNYTVYAPLGNYTLSQVQFPNSLAPYCTPTLTANLNSSNPQLLNLDFADTVSSIVDGAIFQISSTGIVPGFNNKYYMTAGNALPIGYSSILKFVKSPLLSYTTFTPSALSVNGDTAYFAISTYTNPSQQFNIGFYAPPSLPLGLSIPACGYLKVNGTDINLANNTLCYSRLTAGSFDPNDKAVEPAGVGAEGYISAHDSLLTYTVRFQNTGTGPAVNVVIEDTLSQNLNPLTFELLGSSHTCDVNVLQGKMLRWKFSNIMLPDSNSNEPASHGFVQYRIKQKSGNTPGTQIKNTAYIYFDFNEPVITNTTLNTIETVTSVFEKSLTGNELMLIPNPTNGLVTINSQYEMKQIELTNIAGQILLSQTATNKVYQLQLQDYAEGIYFVKVVYANGMSMTKKVVKQ